jgi:capsular polysaccharide biosynthesis protein
MASSEMKEQRLLEHRVPAGYMIAPTSYLVDRIVPECEVIALPAKVVTGGVLKFGTAETQTLPANQTGVARLLRRSVDPFDSQGRMIFEFRSRSPQNWAHFLNNYLPLYFHLCDELGLEWAETVIVTPANTPRYIRQAADLFGLSLIASDGDLVGPSVAFKADPWVATRTMRTDWVRTPPVVEAVANAVANAGKIPERVFLARRKTRTLSNMDEVESFLHDREFSTIYPEELPIADQFAIYHGAKSVVAIHGAGVAPLLYRPESSGIQRLIELMPCGHITDVYRVMSDQVGCKWMAVRGHMKPEYVKPSYDLTAPFKKFSLDAFSIDVRSLELAFRMAQDPAGASNG